MIQRPQRTVAVLLTSQSWLSLLVIQHRNTYMGVTLHSGMEPSTSEINEEKCPADLHIGQFDGGIFPV